MLLRLLLLVLTLVGPLPFRVCTCAATPTICSEPSCPAAPLAKSPCSCGHHHDATDSEKVAPAPSVSTTDTSHTHPAQHQPNCPTSQVRPATDVSLAGQTNETVATQVPAFITPARPAEPDPVAIAATQSRPVPARPLFITLLTLRN